MAKVLGLSFFFHDSAAALVCDGKIVAAGAEERFSRRKHSSEFPKMAIEFCLYAGGLKSINELDAIVFYEKPLIKLFRAVESTVTTWPLSFETFVSKFPKFLSTKVNIYETIREHLPGYKGQILFSQHHLSHAASAYYCSPFDHAAILTLDGVGEWETLSIGVGTGKNIDLQYTLHFPHSIGLLYSALTSYLGFKVNDGEWKVMGLAPYGIPKYTEQFRKLVTIKEDGSFILNLKYFAHHYSSKWTCNLKQWEKLFGFSRRDSKATIEQCHEDLARSGQAIVEELILGLARHARKLYDTDNLVIGGGVGLNSVANWRIQKEGIFKNVWIQPAAGDDGGALGAALVVSQKVFNDPKASRMDHAYLGPAYSNEEIISFLESRQIPFKELSDEDLVSHVSDMIADNKVIGWFRGAMEFGPRSLGGRSIIANPTNPNMKAIINQKIKFREYFRPFAPSVPLEHVHEYFDVPAGTDMPYMLKVPHVRIEKRPLLPAITHEDGTGRVQTVRRNDNPLFYDLMKALIPKIGVPVILNTSFNVRGEPIVCSPEDAYNCFLKTEIDVLVLGNYVVTEKPASEIDIEKSYQRSDLLELTGAEEVQYSSSNQGAMLAIEGGGVGVATAEVTSKKVLNFYKELPFNYYSNSLDNAVELLKSNRIKDYPLLHRHLNCLKNARVLDVGCGAGWFVNSCAHYYGHNVVGIEINPVVLKQARSVNSLFPGNGHTEFIETDLFKFRPEQLFDVVNSLGVLHHTPDCHAAVRQASKWIKKGGYFHLGLYHLHGRRPFLQHFLDLKKKGVSEAGLYEEFARLNPDITDKTHMMSWFRDQVLHPHETQHTYEEISTLLESEGYQIEATSINKYKPKPQKKQIVELEKEFEQRSRTALYKNKRYFPGFFTIWATKP